MTRLGLHKGGLLVCACGERLILPASNHKAWAFAGGVVTGGMLTLNPSGRYAGRELIWI